MTGAWGNPYRPPAGGWPASRRWALGDCEQHFLPAHASRVTRIIVTAPGSGYTRASVLITAEGNDQGRGAVAEAIIEDGGVRAIRLLSGGSHYLVAPLVTITGDGEGAAATAEIGGGLPVLRNTTRVKDRSQPEEPCTATPEPSDARAGHVLHYWRDMPECEPGSGETLSANSHNAFQPDGITDLSVCAKTGFKAVQARLPWHGHLPFFLDATTGTYSARYLTIEVTIKARAYDHQVKAWMEEHEAHVIMRVDRWSGRMERDDFQCAIEIDDLMFADPTSSVAQNLAWWTSPATTRVGGSPQVQYSGRNPAPQLEEAVAVNHVVNTGHEFIWNTRLIGNDLRLWATESAELGPTRIFFALEFDTWDGTDWEPYNRISVDIQLGDPWTIAEVQELLRDMLEHWPLGNDVQYPWRVDGWQTVGPLLFYDGVEGAVEPVPEWDPDWTETAAFTGELRGLSDVANGAVPDRVFSWEHPTYGWGLPWELPVLHYWGAWGPGDLEDTDKAMPAGVTEWTDNATACYRWPGAWVLYDAVTGMVHAQKWAEARVRRPSHNFFRPCGRDRWLMSESRARCIAWITTSGDGYEIGVGGDAPFVAGERVVIFGGELDRTAWVVSSVGSGTVQIGNRVAIEPERMDWAKAQRISSEGHGAGVIAPVRFPNARPICGRLACTLEASDGGTKVTVPEDTDLVAGDRVDFVSYGDDHSESLIASGLVVTPESPRIFTVAVAPALLAGATHVKAHGAPHYKWNDDGCKGDFVVDCWQGTLGGTSPGRDTVIEATGSSLAVTVRQTTPCRPTAIWCSPNAESDLVGTSVDFPVLSEGHVLGNFKLTRIRQHMRDPLWEAPRMACTSWGAEYGTLAEDGGLGNADEAIWDYIFYYAHAPMVEARLTVPDGAPALPAGRQLPSASQPVDGEPNADFVGAQPWELYGRVKPNQPESPWGLKINQRQCVAGDCRWRALYLEQLQIQEVEI